MHITNCTPSAKLKLKSHLGFLLKITNKTITYRYENKTVNLQINIKEQLFIKTSFLKSLNKLDIPWLINAIC